MCKGYPVIRCSAYAKDMLREAYSRMDTAVTFEEKEAAERLKERAEDIYYTTPAGFKDLEERIAETEEGLEKDALFNRLTRGKRERQDKVAENNRLNRVNTDNIRVAKELKETGLPWWAAGCQLAVEEIISENPEADVTINSKTKTFIVKTEDSQSLITTVKHHFTLFVEDDETYVWEGSLQRKVTDLADAFRSRGEGEHILEEELTFGQLDIVSQAVEEHFVSQGYTDLYATEPKLGIVKHVKLTSEEEEEEADSKLKDVFSVVLHTPTKVRNGTDRFNPTSFRRLKEVAENTETILGVEMIEGRVIVEANSEIMGTKNIVLNDEFLLKPLKENFYEARVLGRVKGKQYRVSLLLK